MTVVNTVLGPVDSSRLGFTLMHEHIIICPPGCAREFPELMGADFMERGTEYLRNLKENGIDTIVDATTFDLGRDAIVFAELSRRSGVNIICTAGWHQEIPPRLIGASSDQLAEVFIREVETGIAGTNIKAGILKSASDVQGVLPMEEVVLRAVARAHRRTHAPIMIHSHAPQEVGRQQIAILKDEGVDLRRVKVDHSNDTTNTEYLTWLLEQGCFLGWDRYPTLMYRDPRAFHPGRNVDSLTRTKTMKRLIDAGFAHRLCVSHDLAMLRANIVIPLAMTEQERHNINPHGMLFIKKVVFSQLRELGVPEQVIDSICVDNPRRFFEGG